MDQTMVWNRQQIYFVPDSHLIILQLHPCVRVVLQKLITAQLAKKSPAFSEWKNSFLCPQVGPICTGLYPEQDDYSTLSRKTVSCISFRNTSINYYWRNMKKGPWPIYVIFPLSTWSVSVCWYPEEIAVMRGTYGTRHEFL
jgi:hypothetical protein